MACFMGFLHTEMASQQSAEAVGWIWLGADALFGKSLHPWCCSISLTVMWNAHGTCASWLAWLMFWRFKRIAITVIRYQLNSSWLPAWYAWFWVLSCSQRILCGCADNVSQRTTVFGEYTHTHAFATFLRELDDYQHHKNRCCLGHKSGHKFQIPDSCQAGWNRREAN